jgi:hypothetical protein
MANDLRTGPEPSVTALVTGIVNDIQDLLVQQLNLFKAEIQSDLVKSREAAIPMFIGLGISTVGAGLLFLMLVHLLQWVTEWPLWACHGLIGGGLAVVGGALFFAGKKKFESFNPLPAESVQALKENVRCLMNPK